MVQAVLTGRGVTTTLFFGDAVVTLHEHGAIITWPDGTYVHGEPEDTDEYRSTAFEHGYGEDTLALCQEHELLHVALCYWMGVASPVMEHLRHLPQEMAGAEIRQLEEAAVLAVQKFARAMNIDMVEELWTVASRKARWRFSLRRSGG
jgi:hypothetical protein